MDENVEDLDSRVSMLEIVCLISDYVNVWLNSVYVSFSMFEISCLNFMNYDL